jgi:hypothetical protein
VILVLDTAGIYGRYDQQRSTAVWSLTMSNVWLMRLLFDV